MGSDPIALPMLEALCLTRPAGAEVEMVFTQPDRRTGRGMHLQANAIKSWALGKGIEVVQPAKCGTAEAQLLRERRIELVLVMAYGQILPKPLLEATPYPVLNVHASLLPRLRGASPIHTALALGLKETGVSLMEIIPQLDAGPVGAVEAVAIEDTDTTAVLMEKLARATVELVGKGLQRLRAGALQFTEQDAEKVTYCRIIEKSDNHLDFTFPAESLHNRIRAFQPWPGTAFPFDGLEIRILEARTGEAGADKPDPGTIDTDGQSLRIACGKGWLHPLVLQRPGGKPLPVADFLRGFPLPQGTRLQSRPMREIEADRPFPYKRK